MDVVDLAFPIKGTTIPADHGYLLYSGLSRLLPQLHQKGERAAVGTSDGIGVHPIGGALIGKRTLQISPKSRLMLRMAVDRIPEILDLVGQRIAVGSTEILLSSPQVWKLRPSTSVRSRLVTIKGFLEPDEFLLAVGRQLESLGISGRPGLVLRRSPTSLEGRDRDNSDPEPFVRRTLRVRDKSIVG
jgi:CRISPR-associated protein Cas6